MYDISNMTVYTLDESIITVDLYNINRIPCNNIGTGYYNNTII